MSDTNSDSFASIVEKHIEDLRTHPHIQQVIPVKPLVYKVVYWPQDLDSVYSEMEYNLKLTIPETYPQKPPHLVFLDKIYHLNVHPNLGQVCMSILRDDWSPFLSLKTVFCSLDEVLEDPELQNAATEEQLQEYHQDFKSYVQNAKATIAQNAYRHRSQKNSQNEQETEELVEQVIQVNNFNDFSYDNVKKTSSYNPAVILNESKQGKMNLQLGNLQRKEYSFTESGQAAHSPRSNRSAKQQQSNPVQSPRSNKGAGFLQQVRNSEKIIPTNKLNEQGGSFARYEEVVKDSKIMLNQTQQSTLFDGLKINMVRCQQLIKIFTQQLAQLEQSLQKNKGSKRLKKLFEDRCNKVEDMIVELFNISQKTRIKLMDTVRKDFNKYK